ncbi:MAG TPA: hypothetical protein VK923_13340 [Euzebyales bacterium]|nr:hypothetical protein [Euzebyales bacterium]
MVDVPAQRGNGAGQSSGKHPDPYHGGPDFLDEIAGEPGRSVGDFDEQVAVRVLATEVQQIDHVDAEIERQPVVDEHGRRRVTAAGHSSRGFDAPCDPVGQHGPLVTVQVCRYEPVPVDRDVDVGAGPEAGVSNVWRAATATVGAPAGRRAATATVGAPAHSAAT